MRFTQKDFDSSRIHPQKFHLCYHEYMHLEKTDTTAHLVDDADYKGKLNYGLSFEHKDLRKVTVSETFAMYSIQVSISEFTFNKKDSIATISGIVRGGWKDPKQPFKNQTHIFIGILRDSIHQLRYDLEPEI